MTTNETNGSDKSFNQLHFGKVQLGMTEAGCEKIIHHFRVYSESFPEHDMFFADADNAFNRASRFIGLTELKTHFPHIFPFIKNIYGSLSNGWFFSESGPVAIPSSEGYHQGDVLGSWLFCLTLQPILVSLVRRLESRGLIMFFIDDGNFACHFDEMVEILDLLIHEGREFGYHLNRSKGTYLLGRCGDRDTATARKQLLVDRFNLKPENIKVHPEDGGDESTYGARVVGGFIGADTFVRSSHQAKYDELKEDALAISQVESLQTRYLLLRWCFCQKIIFLQRVTFPSVMNRYLIPKFESLKCFILSTILGLPEEGIALKTQKLASLGIQESGLGFGNSYLTSHAAFLSSYVENVSEKTLMSSGKSLEEVHSSINLIRKYQPDFDIQALMLLCVSSKRTQTLQSAIYDMFREKYRLSVIKLFDSPREIAWLESLHDPDAGLWLDIAPKTTLHTLSNQSFQMALTLR